jgi:hypothetical protein
MIPMPDRHSVSGRAMQEYLLQLFWAKQGVKKRDPKARALRAENAKRVAAATPANRLAKGYVRL